MRSLTIVPMLALLAACSHEPPGPARRVILVTCDTLRADALGVFGAKLPTSPNVDAFAKDGVAFTSAYSSAPITGPSISSLLTGLLPDELGVPAGNRFLIGSDVTTIAEVLRDARIPTAAVVSNWVLRKLEPELGDVGVQQGFETFDDRMEQKEPNRDYFERQAPETTDAAIAWMRARKERGDDRFFLWVHYQDPHGPYLPPQAALDALGPPETSSSEPSLQVGKTQKGLGQIPQYQVVEGETRPSQYARRYAGEVRHFDAHFGRLVAWLKENGWYDDALLVFTADHGESLGEHGYWFCHGENVHVEEVRVPLVVKYPRGATRPSAPVDATLVGHLDVWPTVLEAFGLPARPNRGTSLFVHTVPDRRVNAQVLGAPKALGRWIAIGDGRWRMVQRETKPPMLFDLASDPGEQHDLARQAPDKLRELDERMRRFLSQQVSVHVPTPMKTSPEIERALRGAGYAGDDDEH